MLDGCPADHGPERDQWILAAVKDRADYSFAEVHSDDNGHHGVFSVFADALKIDGVRINASAYLLQQIADALNCMLLTPKLADLIWLQRSCTIKPFPRLITATTEAMIEHSKQIDAELAKLGSPPTLVASTGKHWLIDNDLLIHPGRAENYGWHYQGSDWTGPFELAVLKELTGQFIRMIQGRGWAHDMTHVDYSQTCTLVHNQCVIDGKPYSLKDVLQDPSLASLISHQGPLKVLRQPGVPEMTSILDLA